MIDVLVTDAAPVLAKALAKLELQGVNPRAVNANFGSWSLHVTLTRWAPTPADVVWRTLMDEFKNAGWGYGTAFGDGHDKPRTEMSFSHPTTLTRWR